MKKFNLFHHIDLETITRMVAEYSPVFVLSTGRVGTKFIHTLLSHHQEFQSSHEAFPNLQFFSDFAYHHQDKKDVLSKMMEAARMELVLDAFNNNKIFSESNQCLVFFAYALANWLKKSKFIHVIRHPGDFIVSAVKKGWHKNDSIWEAGRVKSDNECEWASMSQIERLAWTWSETNRFIRDFGVFAGPDRFVCFRAEDLYADKKQVDAMLTFMGAKTLFSDSFYREIQLQKVNEIEIHPDEPPNMKKVPNFPAYRLWPEEDKALVKKYVNPQALEFGYEL